MLKHRNIPKDLKKYSQWVCWKSTPTENGKSTKIPFNPKTGTPAKVNESNTWGTYIEALHALLKSGVYAGIGFVLTQDDPFFGVDLDGCVRNGQISDDALKIINCLTTYSEYSPSKKGVHIIGKGKLPKGGRKKGSVEMYDKDRYLTFTGNHLADTPFEIMERNNEIASLHEKIFGLLNEPIRTRVSHPHCDLTDEEIIKQAGGAKNGEKFKRLLGGNWEGYSSQSEADEALCSILGFYTQDVNQIDGIFRQSGLYRKKWDKKCYSDGTTYGTATIRKSLENKIQHFTPKKGKKVTNKPKFSANFPGLIELVIDENKNVLFLVKDGVVLKAVSTWEIDGIQYVPPEKKHFRFLLPRVSEVIKHYGKTDDNLFEDILSYLKRFSYLSNEEWLIVACFVLLTYLQDHPEIHYLPIILFYAVPERGKSRTGKAVTYISYRGVHSVDVREANLFRYSEDLQATIFLDVMNLWKRVEKNGSEDILLSRFEKGGTVSRVLYPEKGPFEGMVHFAIYGPTFIATNEAVHKILDTRCITITMPNKPGYYENPTQELGLELKERLTAWRAKVLFKPLPKIEPIKGIEGRLWDISRPLLQACMLLQPESVADLTRSLLVIAGKRIEEKRETIEGKIVEVLGELSEENLLESSWTVSTKVLLEKINANRRLDQQLTSQYIGRRLKAIGLNTKIIHGYSKIYIKREEFKLLCEQHGVVDIFRHIPEKTLPNSTNSNQSTKHIVDLDFDFHRKAVRFNRKAVRKIS